MEAVLSSSSLTLTSALNKNRAISNHGNSTATVRLIKNQRPTCRRIAAITDVSAAAAAADSGQVEVTWQIIVGAIAGITPFVVAGIEFSKRIIAQRRCEVCGGTGIVLRGKDYFRCPGCGGFLPWQSWKRFFSG